MLGMFKNIGYFFGVLICSVIAFSSFIFALVGYNDGDTTLSFFVFIFGLAFALITKKLIGKRNEGEIEELEYDEKEAVLHLLIYKDVNGKLSERKIKISSLFSKNNRDYMSAMDVEINELRTFRKDRIIRLTDLESGESII